MLARGRGGGGLRTGGGGFALEGDIEDLRQIYKDDGLYEKNKAKIEVMFQKVRDMNKAKWGKKWSST